ncbi:MAG: hypothetical protein KZQ93_06960 [Candidatus Thiodiazotropha sp. (ex Monitilora ramsayi)]|nr:hypothetical protein [Candidatus Thiodiazotropha sp. (ex Monitilora ramsayi)]
MEEVASEIRKFIETAFAGVRLDGGVSLKQAIAIDNYMEGVTEEEFAEYPNTELIDDWIRIPYDHLEPDPCISHFDAKGFRYYIPRLMLSVLDKYDPGSMRVIGTIQALYPKKEYWEYHMKRYSELNDDQKYAIAKYVEVLPSFINLDYDDRTCMQRALVKYWSQYIN